MKISGLIDVILEDLNCIFHWNRIGLRAHYLHPCPNTFIQQNKGYMWYQTQTVQKWWCTWGSAASKQDSSDNINTADIKLSSCHNSLTADNWPQKRHMNERVNDLSSLFTVRQIEYADTGEKRRGENRSHSHNYGWCFLFKSPTNTNSAQPAEFTPNSIEFKNLKNVKRHLTHS